MSTNLQNCFDEEIIDQKKEYNMYLNYAKDLVHDAGKEEDYLQFDDPETEELRWFNFSHKYKD